MAREPDRTICITVHIEGLGEVECYGIYDRGSPEIVSGPPDNWTPGDASEFRFSKVLINALELETINGVDVDEWLDCIHDRVIDQIETI